MKLDKPAENKNIPNNPNIIQTVNINFGLYFLLIKISPS